MILDIAWEEDSILPDRREPLTTLLTQAIKEAIRLSGGSEESEVSLMLVDDQRIHALNQEYRGVDRPTDCSFVCLARGHGGGARCGL